MKGKQNERDAVRREIHTRGCERPEGAEQLNTSQEGETKGYARAGEGVSHELGSGRNGFKST
jgi:hypothetical protein